MKRLEPWTRDEIVSRFREAGDTVKRLPRAKGPASYGSGWPQIVQDARDAYGYTEARIALPAPSPRAIDRTYEVFSWFRFFDGDVDEMRAVWLCAGCGYSVANASRKIGVSRATIRSRARAGVYRIVAGLNRLSTVATN